MTRLGANGVRSTFGRWLRPLPTATQTWWDYAKFKGASGADPFVVAAAIVERDQQVLLPREAIVVTNEREHGPSRIAIPDACKSEGIDCLNIERWFLREGWRV